MSSNNGQRPFLWRLWMNSECLVGLVETRYLPLAPHGGFPQVSHCSDYYYSRMPILLHLLCPISYLRSKSEHPVVIGSDRRNKSFILSIWYKEKFTLRMIYFTFYHDLVYEFLQKSEENHLNISWLSQTE